MTIDPVDAALPSLVLQRRLDHGDSYHFDDGNRLASSAGGTVHVYAKGPASTSARAQISGLDGDEVQALRDYIDDTLDGAVETFRLQMGTRTNLLAHTRDLSNAVWTLESGPVLTVPSATLDPRGHSLASQIVYGTGDAGAGLEQAAHDGRGSTSGLAYEAAIWVTGSSAVGDALELTVEDSAGAIATKTDIDVTTSWVRHTCSSTASATNSGLLWRLEKLGSLAATVHVARPALHEGSAVGARFEAVEAETGLVNYRLASPQIRVTEAPVPGMFHVTMSLLKVGS